DVERRHLSGLKRLGEVESSKNLCVRGLDVVELARNVIEPAAGPKVVGCIDRERSRGRTARADIVDDAFIAGGADAAVVVRAVGVRPWSDIAESGRSLDHPIAVAILALRSLRQPNANDGTLAAVLLFTIARPYVAEQIDRRA